ncbi:MAG TPA: D-arabinono-1,4-lactone oxidase [Solirubrobacterales bacterium]|nr:D-arabinono-1,4-lactone oxidase [Solirubrobacterales bacterium]
MIGERFDARRAGSEGRIWTNWSGHQTCRPRDLIQVSGLGELAEVVGRAARKGRQVTTVGSGHSFTPTALSDDLLLDISRVAGVISVDRGSGLVEVGGGTILADLNRELDRLGLAMPNLGDIDRQTIAGAVSTGTHGTGLALPNISAQIERIKVMDASGVVHEFDAGSDELLAARVAIGSLGVITSITLRTVPSFNLHRVDAPMDLDQVLGDFERLCEVNEHFEFFVFPYTRTALTLSRNRTGRPLAPRSKPDRFLGDVLIENGLGDLALRAAGKFRSAIPKMARYSTGFMSQSEQVDISHRVFANYRTIRFNEMEYALPVEVGPTVLEQVLTMIEREGFPLPMPIECRVSAGDDALISQAHGRPTAYIAIHQHRTMEHEPYFREIEEIFREVDGRPHWGKLHFRSAEDLAPGFPRWSDFQAVRDRLDPDRTFSNPYVTEVLGP